MSEAGARSDEAGVGDTEAGPPGRVLLALDTSGPVGSVALGHGGEVMARRFLDDRRAHASRLMPAVQGVLDDAGYDRGEVDGVVVGAGPGSFTGVRVAAATAKGMVHGLGVPLWAVSSLEAAAVPVPDLEAATGAGTDWGATLWETPPDLAETLATPPDVPRHVLFDARGDRVYAGCYRLADAGFELLVEPTATTLSDLLAGWLPDGVVFAGSGALRHRTRLFEAGHTVLPPPTGMPTADGLLRILALDPDRAPLTDASGWEPDYLRASGAERAVTG